MSALDGNIKLGLDLETKSAEGALSSFKNKVRQSFNTQDTKGLDQSIKTTESNIKKLENELDKTREKLQDLTDSEVAPKSVKEMEKELTQTESKLAKLDKQFEKLSTEQVDLADRQVPGLTLEQSLSPEQQARFKELDSLIIENGQQTDVLTAKANHLRQVLDSVKMNPSLSAEGKKFTRQIQVTNDKLQQQKKTLKELQAQSAKTGKTATLHFKGLESVLRRIKGLIKRVLFFSIITKGLNSMKRQIIELIHANNGLSASLSTIKGNLSVAFAPLWEFILPHLQNFLNILVQISGAIASFMSSIFGVTIQHSQQVAEGFKSEAEAIGGAGKAAKKAKKELASFDTMNVFHKDESDAGGGAGGGGAKTPEPMKTDFTIDDTLKKKLQGLLVLVGLIGAALAAWKISQLLKDLPMALSKLKLILGLVSIIAGAFLLVKGYTDAWANGVSWKNLAMMLGGLILLVGGISLAISPLAGAFVLVGGGIAFMVLAIKDMIDNGPTFQNVLLLIAGAIAVVAGAWIILNWAGVGSALIIALIVGAIALLIGIFVYLWKTCDGFRQFWIDLWENHIKPVLDEVKEKAKQLWDETIKPKLQEMGEKFKTVWEEKLQPAIENLGEKLEWLWDNVLGPLLEFVTNVFLNQFSGTFDSIADSVSHTMEFISGLIDGLMDVLEGIIDFITGVFTGDWEMAWDGLKQVFKGILNGIITMFEGAINFFIDALNFFIRNLSGVTTAIGDVIGVDLTLNTIQPVSLPRLAQGAVIPANKEFMAVLGDQKHGTNLEAPEDLIRQIVREESGNKNFTIEATGSMAPLIRYLALKIKDENGRVSAY